MAGYFASDSTFIRKYLVMPWWKGGQRIFREPMVIINLTLSPKTITHGPYCIISGHELEITDDVGEPVIAWLFLTYLLASIMSLSAVVLADAVYFSGFSLILRSTPANLLTPSAKSPSGTYANVSRTALSR